MPQVPSVDAPSVTQSGAPVNVSTPDSAFGASVLGSGLDKLGATLGVGSDAMAKHAEQFQLLNNKAEADGGFTAQLQQSDQYVADFKSNNLGKAAAVNLPQAMKDLDTQRQAISTSMSNPTAKAMFDADSRRALANNTGELTRFAATENKKYNLQQATAAQEALSSDSIIHLDHFDANMASMQERQVYINQQLGLSPEQGELEARKLYGNTVAMISETLAGNGDVTRGHAFLEAHKDGMDGTVYASTLMKLKPALMANDAADIGHAAVQDALHGLNSPVGPTLDYVANVHGREGDAKNPHSTADGIGQFTQGTWAKMMQKPEFAQDVAGKTPAEILALRHDPSVANRAIIAYGHDNAGYLSSKNLPVNSATVGLAHGYGPAGAESLLHADPNAKVETIIGAQVAKNNGVLGQTVGQVVGAFTQRFGVGSTDANVNGTPTSYQLAAREQAVIALVHNGVVAKYGENALIEDQARSKALAELNSQIGAARNLETQAYTTLGSFAQNNQIQDLPTLLKSVPNGLQAYNSLPLSQRTLLQADLHRNSTELTSPRFANVTALDGMWGSRTENPQAFLNADITHMDLTQGDRLKWMQKQADFRGKPASAIDPEAKALGQIVKMPEYKAVMGSDGLNIKPNSQDEYLLRGSIAGQLQNWFAAHPGKSPQQSDILPMIAHATSQHSSHWELFGHNIGPAGTEQSLPDINDEDKTAIAAALTRHGIPVSPFTIGKYYAMGKGAK